MKRNSISFHAGIIITVIAVILALILILFAVIFICPLFESVDKTPVSGSADWMAQIDDNTPLSEITIPCTHNSGTQYSQLAFFSKCQSLGIADQLESGYRYLDIRLGLDEESGRLKLMHGFTDCMKSAFFGKPLMLTDVLGDCYSFLDAHPTETVIFCVKHEHGDFSVGEMQELLNDEIAGKRDHWLLSDTLPKLGEARGKLVLLRRYDDEADLGEESGVPFAWADQGGLADPVEDIGINYAGELTLYVQDRYEYDVADKWVAFTTGLEIGVGDGEAAVHFLSTKGSQKYGHPYYFARRLNSQLIGYDLPSDTPVGWIIVDFGSVKLAEKIYSCNW